MKSGPKCYEFNNTGSQELIDREIREAVPPVWLSRARLNKEIKEDLLDWLKFLDLFNGTCRFDELDWVESPDLALYTDSAGGDGSKGGTAYLHPHWAFLSWPEHWLGTEIMKDITFLELAPIVLAFHLWSTSFKDKRIVLFTDNLALVSVLNKKSSKSTRIMQLVRPLVLYAMLNNINFKARHVAGVENGIADSISRRQWQRFRQLAPEADRDPSPIPESFQELIFKMKV
ncbi:uncharacterized protein LOC110441519 [Mizuhopecten yessoensis]|uniref:uncharacterized protein LOC110441519 n=1 Tax=Mizuhopecten yessoensis TaxID=6573 RepID=UPI000B457CBF|nr:uncharacterized protein LOC110441519 [Mizuhopecten yessoensis]